MQDNVVKREIEKMPKKFAIVKLREWLEQYEQGKSEASIAKDARCDVRTVKKGIEDARRERDVRGGRADLVKEALRRHQARLLSIIEEIRLAVKAGPPDLRVPWGEKDGTKVIELAAARVVCTLDKLLVVTLNVEGGTEWELLQEHLKGDPLWSSLSRWKSALVADVAARIALRRRAANLLEKKTGLKIDERTRNGPFLFTNCLVTLYELALNRALGIPYSRDLQKDMQIYAPNGEVILGAGTGLAKAPGAEVKCRDNILRASKALLASPELDDIAQTYRDLEEATTKAERAAEEVALLGLVPGSCRVCRRLGM